ncbi:hypothetical protein PIB30_068316 [Stylosanthes scabra]|uniref:Uncharacterized protein n=1 Tax=Stylosanthes scabra TaxID=79078 RepID=A0ABU6RMS8_9FABA|nr:hypothetical protein [Stylosanthes scabra]
MNTTNPKYGWLSRNPRNHTLSNGRVGGINPVSFVLGFSYSSVTDLARNGAPAPCPWRPRALHVDFVIKQRVARPRHLGHAAARSTQIFIWTIIHRCEALDVSFPMALEPSHLDLYSSSYDQIRDIRSGLTALRKFCALIFGCEFVIKSHRTGRGLQHESCRHLVNISKESKFALIR